VRDGDARGKAYAAYALANLSSGNAANTAAIVAAGAIGPLAVLVRDGDARGKANAAHTLAILSSGNAANTAAFAAAGAIGPLAALVRDGDAQGKAYAAHTLAILSSGDAANTAAIVAAGAIGPLAVLVRDGDARGKAYAANALANLSSGDAANTAAIVAAGAIVPLAALVRDGDARGKANAAHTLAILSSGNAANTEAIVAAGAIGPLEGQLAASGAAKPSRKMVVDTSEIMSAVNTNDTFLVKQWISTIGPERAQAQINGTPALLNRAVHNGRDEMVQILLEACADPDAYAKACGTPRAGETWPLRLAVQSGFQGIVKMLLDHGAQLDHGWKHAMSAYQQHGGTFTGQDDQAQSLLCTASLKGFVTIVELLLDRHADVDGGPCEPGVYPSSLTPLMHAAYHGKPDVIELLLQRRANPSLVLNHANGSTALDLAEMQGNDHCIELLEPLRLPALEDLVNARSRGAICSWSTGGSAAAATSITSSRRRCLRGVRRCRCSCTRP
jgi:ankyrin repeat protein